MGRHPARGADRRRHRGAHRDRVRGGLAGWYYDDELDPETALSIAIAVPALLGGIYGLGPLFLLTGWFSVTSLAWLGPARFAWSRLVRLGIPLLLFLAVVNPAADYFGNLNDEQLSFLGYLAVTEFTVLWFVAALLACSLGYAVLRAVRPPSAHPTRPSPGSWVLAAMLIWQWSDLVDSSAFNVRFGAWLQGAVLFALGVAAAEAGYSATVPRGMERRLAILLVGGLVLTIVALIPVALSSDLGGSLHGLTWSSVTFAVSYGIVSVAFTLWCLSWVSRRWPTHGRVVDLAGRGSYVTYVTHPLWLTLLMLAFSPVPVPAVAKFVVVAALAIPICFGIGYGITRLPVLRRVF